jgi:hypothetical protein
VRKRRSLDRSQLALDLEPRDPTPFPAIPNAKGLPAHLKQRSGEAEQDCGVCAPHSAVASEPLAAVIDGSPAESGCERQRNRGTPMIDDM